jgi:Zn-dependent peptidase ImmA (M78 family)/transcriptional regulator with XRE-family HTH domain
MSVVNDAVIGERLQMARKVLGLSLQEVAAKVGFANYQTLASIETGERPAKVSELARLADVYFKDLAFFLSESEAMRSNWSIAWRKKDYSLTTSAIEGRVFQVLADYQLLEELTGEMKVPLLEPWSPSTGPLDRDSVSEKAEKLQCQLGLGSRPASVLKDVLEDRLRIKFLYLDMGEGVSAVSAKGDFGYAIVIDSKEAPWRRSFSLAHELFHLYASAICPLEQIHKKTTNGKSNIEKLADQFAACLLLPADALNESIKQYAKGNRLETIDLISIALEYKVSTQALLYRMENLGLFAEAKADDIIRTPEFETLNAALRRNRNESELEYSRRMISLALKAVQQGKISRGRACKMFRVSRSQFESFLSQRGYTESIHDTEVVLSHT